jgi:hypothetical protein
MKMIARGGLRDLVEEGVGIMKQHRSALAAARDAAVQMIDTSVVRVHQHGACITKNQRQSMGRSRGGLTSKIHAVVDSNGLPVRLALSPGEAHDVRLVLNGLRPLVHMAGTHDLRHAHQARARSTSTRRRRDAKTRGRIEDHSHRVTIVAASAVSICSVYRV